MLGLEARLGTGRTRRAMCYRACGCLWDTSIGPYRTVYQHRSGVSGVNQSFVPRIGTHFCRPSDVVSCLPLWIQPFLERCRWVSLAKSGAGGPRWSDSQGKDVTFVKTDFLNPIEANGGIVPSTKLIPYGAPR